MKKYKVELFITGCLIAILIGAMIGYINYYEEKNTKLDFALVEDCYISDDGYITVLNYNNYEYKTTDENTYIKCISRKNKLVPIYVTTIKLSKLLIFDDEILIKVK